MMMMTGRKVGARKGDIRKRVGGREWADWGSLTIGENGRRRLGSLWVIEGALLEVEEKCLLSFERLLGLGKALGRVMASLACMGLRINGRSGTEDGVMENEAWGLMRRAGKC
jgi:hypothetical protein